MNRDVHPGWLGTIAPSAGATHRIPIDLGGSNLPPRDKDDAEWVGCYLGHDLTVWAHRHITDPDHLYATLTACVSVLERAIAQIEREADNE